MLTLLLIFVSSVRIAEDSRRVAILARQDSTDMRVIAGTTLLFLPATFVAVSFSQAPYQFCNQYVLDSIQHRLLQLPAEHGARKALDMAVLCSQRPVNGFCDAGLATALKGRGEGNRPNS